MRILEQGIRVQTGIDGLDIRFLCSFELLEIDPEDPTSCWTIVIRPARMNAGIAANEGAIVHGKSVRIGRAGNELHRLKHSAGGGVILHQGGTSLREVLAVISHQLPD